MTEPKKKTASKKKNAEQVSETPSISVATSEPLVAEKVQPTVQETEENDTKKRGRKPRGAKITTKQIPSSQNTNAIPNIILHLKCNMSDLNEYNHQLAKLLNLSNATTEDTATLNDEIYTYDNADVNYAMLTNNANNLAYQKQLKYVEPVGKHGEHYGGPTASICQKCMLNIEDEDVLLDDPEVDNVSTKELTGKLKSLKIQLYKNYLKNDTKSACFWCTCEYDNMSCYIPKYEIDGVIYGYGSFCRPECGVAYLMREGIDDSTKFERYHMMNQIYGKLYGCKKNIKPAPNPYYLLDKFYGNLSIQEYRKLLKTDHLYMVIEKPLTRILPELHEDNDELSSSIYDTVKSTTSANGVYKVKRQSEKQQGPSKMSILKQNFNMG